MNITIARMHELDIDTTKFTDAVNAYIFTYGLKQVLNDAGSAGKSPDEKLAMAEKKLAALYEGTVRAAREGGGDPIKAEMARLAVANVNGRIKAAGRKIKEFTDEQLQVAYDRYIAANEASLRELAVERLAQVKSAPVVDISDLGL